MKTTVSYSLISHVSMHVCRIISKALHGSIIMQNIIKNMWQNDIKNGAPVSLSHAAASFQSVQM